MFKKLNVTVFCKLCNTDLQVTDLSKQKSEYKIMKTSEKSTVTVTMNV